jgi:hypothetical protein
MAALTAFPGHRNLQGGLGIYLVLLVLIYFLTPLEIAEALPIKLVCKSRLPHCDTG